jgi:hypothetical protein
MVNGMHVMKHLNSFHWVLLDHLSFTCVRQLMPVNEKNTGYEESN